MTKPLPNSVVDFQNTFGSIHFFPISIPHSCTNYLCVPPGGCRRCPLAFLHPHGSLTCCPRDPAKRTSSRDNQPHTNTPTHSRKCTCTNTHHSKPFTSFLVLLTQNTSSELGTQDPLCSGSYDSLSDLQTHWPCNSSHLPYSL